jgi:hypothetical protein
MGKGCDSNDGGDEQKYSTRIEMDVDINVFMMMVTILMVVTP